MTTFAVGLATLLRWLLDPVLGDHFPYPTFFIAVIFAAWYGGWRTALLATNLGFFIALYLFIAPRFSFSVIDGVQALGMVIYMAVCITTAVFAELMRRSQVRTEIAEQRAIQQAAILRAVSDSSQDMIFVKDRDCRMVFANPATLAVIGLSEKEVVGTTEADRPSAVLSEAAAIMENDRRIMASGKAEVLEETLTSAEGTRIYQSSKSPMLDDAGAVVGIIGIGRDITKQKQAAEDLRKLTAELSEADRRKDEFLATLAHELRNPLAPIRNGLQILRLTGGAGDEAEQARIMMERQIGQMVHLVDDLLDVSRISRGKLELRKERIELATVVRDAVETSRPLIESQGHEVKISVPSQPVMIEADVTRLVQVFANLLNNACKYSERGGLITLTAHCRDGEVVVSVVDAGVGIPQEMLPKIFELFTQVDGSLERSQGGLGIGLTLVKRLVEMHGGSIEARSEGAGKGSEFIVRLPIAISSEQEVAPKNITQESVITSHRCRVLVADDNKDAAFTLAMLLKMMGSEVRKAHDGLEAVKVAAEFLPELILLDIGMPKLNGYEACRRIREQPWGKDIVIIALTGWGQDEDKRRSEVAGFSHHMVKPVDPKAIEALLAELSVSR